MLRNHRIRAVVTLAIAFCAIAAPARAAEFGLRESPRITWHEPLDIGYLGITANAPIDPVGYKPGGLNAVPLTPDLRAGANADVSVDLSFTRRDENAGSGDQSAAGVARDIDFDLPAGFYGDPSNYPSCTPEAFAVSVQCVPGSQVGILAGIIDGNSALAAPVFNMATDPDEPAKLAFSLPRPVTIELASRTDGDYGLTAHVGGLQEALGVLDLRLTLWGNPSDPVHDRLRVGRNGFSTDDSGDSLPIASDFPQLPFLTAPARCDAPLTTTVRVRPWLASNPARTYQVQAPARTGCESLRFDPALTAAPSTADAGLPTGLDVDLAVPQTNSIESLSTPNVEDVSVTLPEGVAISPGGADGLSACSDEQLATTSRAPETCPERSKVGTTMIDTPVLEEPLLGNVYLGEQLSQDPASGDMYRLFVMAYAKGVRVKLKGNVVADPVTGRLTATFRQNPQLPFSNLKLRLKDGPRALLTNPASCGTGTVHLEASSYAGNTVSKDSSYVVSGNCATAAFAPSLLAGTVDASAGALSPFTTTIARPDGQADLASVKLDLPPGLLGAISSVPICAEAQAAAGSCGAESRVGSTAVSVGTGSAPFRLPGTVSLAGPYKGAPFSLSIAVPAKAGPLDLGLVVVRAPLVVDAARAQVSAPVDALPQIVGGVPLHYRSISVNLDRPGFMFNATSCTASEVVATLTSTSGVVSRQATRYQPQGCEALRLRPALKLTYAGSRSGLRKGRNPALTAELSQRFGESGLKRVAVTLPTISSLAPENAETLCSVAQFEARSCPTGSIVGKASAQTPALPTPLTGPIFLVQGQRTTSTGRVVRTLPKLFLELEGSGVPLDLVADTGVDAQQRLVTTFPAVPDAPLSKVRLEIDGGKRGILTAVEDPCQPRRRAAATFDGHNGARVTRSLQIAAPSCRIRLSTKAGKRGVQATVSNIAPGKITVRGKGLRQTSKTVRSGESTSLTARRTKRAPRRTRIRVTFDPTAKGQKTQTLTRRVTIRP